MLDARAFATAILLATVGLVPGSTAHAGDISIHGIQFNLVQGGTAAPAGNGYGVVTNDFYMGEFEVTVAQYANFLNATGAPNGTFKPQQPITLSGTTYVPNAGFANRPITNVSWFDAARFVNWLENGAGGGSDTETGSYTLNGGSTVVARNPGATFVLPSANEWTKAAYYNPNQNNWNLYGTNSNTAPAATIATGTNPNAANYDKVVGSTTDVGAYAITTSAYGLFDMVGNVAEMTDTFSGSDVIRTGGNWNQLSIPTSNTALTFGSAATFNGNLGFRVAAVPEPSTYAMIGVGAVSLGGFRWVRRRRRVRG